MSRAPLSARTRRFGPATLAIVLTSAGVAGCGPNHGQPFTLAMAEAQRAESAGRFPEAAAKYDAASREARIPRDAEHAQYLSAMMATRAGDDAQATEKLRVLAASTSKTAPAEASEFQLAQMAIDRGDASEGIAAMEKFFTKHASSGLARPALMRVLRDRDAGGDPSASLAYVRSLRQTLGSSELGETLAYEEAKRLESLGQRKAARDAYVAMAARWPYPGGKLFDDALFHASELDEALGEYALAVAHLQQMLRERETTTILGSYQRPMYTPALMRIAKLYRDRLNDRVRARDAFHRVYVEFTTSLLRDDALFEEAALFREDHDEATACARLATLVHDFPDSRYVACATATCPSLRRPEKSKAPATCPTYVTRRQVGPGAD